MARMTNEGTRLLYLARHAEPTDDGLGLSARGTRQAELLGQRLAHLPVDRLSHGPLPRAAETAHVVAAQLRQPPAVTVADEAGDYVPSVPGRDEVPSGCVATVSAAFADVSEEEATRGAVLAARAVEVLAGPADDGRTGRTPRAPLELVVTHAFTIGWLVRHALGAPAWRWWGQDHCHAGITVIRYQPDRPPALVVVNDTSHLPAALRWTGFPDAVRLPG
jgi:probable phosphoglycerate mutase